MNIIQFLRILRARSPLVFACTLFTLLGAIVVILVVPARYEATARIMLGLLKPDAVTGEAVVPFQGLGPYVETQRELIKDYRVTGPVVDRLGWLTHPGYIARYQQRPATDTRDFRRWLAQKVAEQTNAKLVSGTILEISFASTSPVEAKLGSEVLRESFMNYTLAARRQDATRSAQWYAGQAESARKLAESAELTKAAYEKQNGILLQGDEGGARQDIDSARLAALVSQAATAPAALSAPPPVVNSQASLQLAQIDSEIAENAEKLGPNHPMMQQLRARRALVAQVAAKEQASAQNGPRTADAVGAISRALRDQKTLVIGQRDKVERLRQLQAEVDLRREQYKKTAARAAELFLEAGIADPGMSVLGVVVTPDAPKFPNRPLVIGGSLGLGLAFGLFLAVLIELLNRHVRGVEDLKIDRDFDCLAVIPSASGNRRGRRRATSKTVASAGAAA